MNFILPPSLFEPEGQVKIHPSSFAIMFDPTLPQENTLADAVQMRGQLNGLKALIDAVPTLTAAQVDSTTTLPQGSPANASVNLVGNMLHFSFEIPQGQEGMIGPVGPPFGGAVVDGVNTLPPGDSATVSVSFDGSNVRFIFGIPRGNDGNQGPQGGNGNDGGPGPQGPPFAQAVVDGVTTLNPAEPATVQTSFDGSNVRFNFGIPRGNDGQPGEISQTQLDSAILNSLNGTSNNTNGVSTLDTGFADPDMEALRQKLNEMILNGRR
ncbi:MAG: hypothetical protein NTV80_18825 [Verrucomicrobia bacterium]|nr:hypothetical protein [Verrucomicrobiota bacterium]